MREDHQKERPFILPLSLQRKVRGENTPPKSDPDKSAGELNEGRPHPTPEPPRAFPDREPAKKKTGEF
jgi:hypothetical protein